MAVDTVNVEQSSSAEMPTGERRPGRSVALDFLRGIAILLVIGAHNKYAAPDSGPVYWLHRFWDHYGWTGVDLFFVLSGFLVGGLLFRELKRNGRIDTKSFLFRRAFKIWPLYFVYVGYSFVTFGLKGGLHFEGTLVPNLLHLQNYLGSPLGHTWSLAVEEHFYLILVFLMAIVASRKKITWKGVAWTALGAIVVCTLLRIPVAGDEYNDLIWARRGTHLRLDGLAVGVFLAATYHMRPDLWERIAKQKVALAFVATVGFASIAFFPKEGYFDRTVGYCLLYFGGAAALILLESARTAGVRSKVLQFWPVRVVASIGIWSYGIYLWHLSATTVPVEWVLRKADVYARFGLGAGWMIASTIFTLLAILVGALMTVAVEKPFLAIRDRINPSKVRGLPTDR